MRKQTKRFIYGADANVKATDQNIMKLLLPSFMGIIICLICLAGMAWAWFSAGVHSQSTVTAGSYSLGETVSKIETGGSETPVTKDEAGNYTIDANSTYKVIMTPGATPANGGYCLIKINDGTGETTFKTVALNDTSSFEFTISNGNEEVTCKIIAAWGDPTKEGTSETLIENAGTITLNGGAPEAATDGKETTEIQAPEATQPSTENESQNENSENVNSNESDGNNSL